MLFHKKRIIPISHQVRHGKKSLSILVFTCLIGVLLISCGDDGSSNASEDYTPKYDAEDGYDAKTNTLRDARDGQIYRTTTIGDQVWMAENLNYDYNIGNAVSFCYDAKEVPCYRHGENQPCSYNKNCDRYGRLYLWPAAMDSAAQFSDAGKDCGPATKCNSKGLVRGACPQGWHLPDDDEWQILLDAAGGEDSAGINLRAITEWEPLWEKNFRTTDPLGFSALPGGHFWADYEEESHCHYLGDEARFWSSSEIDKMKVHEMCIYRGGNATLSSAQKSDGASIRCIRDSRKGNGKFTPVLSDAGCKYDEETNTLTDLRDNQTYRTVTIGSQTWMAENLNYVLFIPAGKEIDSLGTCPDNNPELCEKYGRTYTYDYNTENRIICPDGWHIPNIDEWKTLITHVTEDNDAGKQLKSSSEWEIDGNGIDAYNFSILPSSGTSANFLSSDYGNIEFYSDKDFASLNYENYGNVRCLMDSPDNQSKDSEKIEFVEPSSVKTGTLTDDRDGQTYKTVTIGTQTWMAENLNYAYNIPTSELDSSSFCFNNETDSCTVYGRLYLWSAAMDSAAVFSEDGKGCGDKGICTASSITADQISFRGVCPEGWHIPNNNEWKTLYSSIDDGSERIDKRLKSTEGWNKAPGTDQYDFSIKAAGLYITRYISEYSGIWSSSTGGVHRTDSKELRTISFYRKFWPVIDGGFSDTYNNTNVRASVRCVKD